LKSCDATPRRHANLGDVLARDRITDKKLSESSFLTKGTVRLTAGETGLWSRYGYQTNSSTFGTLLSSQGSSAHLSAASRPFRGATCKNLPGPHPGVKSAEPVPAPWRDASSSVVRGRLGAHSKHLS